VGEGDGGDGPGGDGPGLGGDCVQLFSQELLDIYGPVLPEIHVLFLLHDHVGGGGDGLGGDGPDCFILGLII
jgi:hypothetical protein